MSLLVGVKISSLVPALGGKNGEQKKKRYLAEQDVLWSARSVGHPVARQLSNLMTTRPHGDGGGPGKKKVEAAAASSEEEEALHYV